MRAVTWATAPATTTALPSGQELCLVSQQAGRTQLAVNKNKYPSEKTTTYIQKNIIDDNEVMNQSSGHRMSFN